MSGGGNSLPPPPPPAPGAPPRLRRFAPARAGGGAWQEEAAVPGAAAPEPIELGIAHPDLRYPRLGATANGTRIDHLLMGGSVHNNSFHQADRFSLQLALKEEGEADFRFWADTDKIEVEVFAGFGRFVQPNKSLILGRVDDVDVDLAERTLTVTGRDYTAEMIDTKTSEKWPNRTASEIVEEIASKHGLTPVVTATTVRVGKLYEVEHARVSDQTTEWNLLTFLAEQEGMELYVSGRELHFEPPGGGEQGGQRWTITYTPPTDGRPPEAVADRLQLRQSKELSREVSVKVVSWNSSRKKAFTRTASTNLSKRGGIGGVRTPYVYRLPGLTEEQAQREAERRLADITRHLRVISVSMPGHPDITPRAKLALTGTGTSWDQEYRIDQIVREISQGGGFDMNIDAKNIPPEAVASIA